MRMSFVMRATMAIGACAVMGATAGCGAAMQRSQTASRTPPPDSAVSASPSRLVRNPQVTSATSPVLNSRSLSSDLPAGGPPLEQISDGEMNKTGNTDQRGFANTGNTYRIEDDVVLDTSTHRGRGLSAVARCGETQFASADEHIVAGDARLSGR